VGERWNFSWRRRPFAWEETLIEELVEVLQTTNLTDNEDKWRWTIDPNGEFSVKSTYVFLSDLLVDRGNLSGDQISAFKAIWKCPAPSKVMGFAWQVLHDRIPTKVNLFRRKILLQPADQDCSLW
jgi:hypothetical protein